MESEDVLRFKSAWNQKELLIQSLREENVRLRDGMAQLDALLKEARASATRYSVKAWDADGDIIENCDSWNSNRNAMVEEAAYLLKRGAVKVELIEEGGK